MMQSRDLRKLGKILIHQFSQILIIQVGVHPITNIQDGITISIMAKHTSAFLNSLLAEKLNLIISYWVNAFGNGKLLMVDNHQSRDSQLFSQMRDLFNIMMQEINSLKKKLNVEISMLNMVWNWSKLINNRIQQHLKMLRLVPDKQDLLIIYMQ